MRSVLVCFSASVITLCTLSSAEAQSVVTLAPAIGNPGATVSVSGTKFAAREAVDIFVDNADSLLVVSSAAGAFNGQVTVPPGAAPGAHFITAIGRHSGLAAQAQFSVSTDWNQMGFSATHTGFNPFENTVNPGNVASLGVLWHSRVAAGGNVPAVVGGQVFVTGIGIQARTVASGLQKWSKETSDSFQSSPTVVDGVVYAGSTGSIMYALNAKTGAEIWKKTLTEEVFASPVVAGNLVYVGCNDGIFYALNKATGAIVWKFTTGGTILSPAAVAGGLVYVGSADKTLYALNALNGHASWSYTAGGLVEGAPAVSNGVVYFGSSDGKVNAVRVSNGSPLWSYTTGGAVDGAVSVALNIVYAQSFDGKLYAFNAHSGAVRWSTAIASGSTGAPVVADGVVYATGPSGAFHALNAATGDILWSVEVGSFPGGAAVANGVVYVNSGAGTYAFAAGKTNDARNPTRRPPAPSSLHPNRSLLVTR